jgi:pimeloyl-[acyl-carrier protein] methyl ester esterase
MAYLIADGGKQVYFEYHQGRKRPVFLIHGWAMSGAVWISSVEALRDQGHAVILLDHRGCGRSDKDFEDQSIAAIAGDVVAIIEKIGAKDVVLNGWSLGAAVAADAAARLGTRASALVFTCGASPRYTRSDDFDLGAAAEDVRGIPAAARTDRAAFFQGLTQAALAKPVSQPMKDWIWSIFMQSGAGALQTLLGLIDLDQRSLLAQLDIPLLAITGSADAITAPALGECAARTAKQGKVVSLEGCGHTPFLEDFAAYHRALDGFLTGLEA